MIRWRSDKMGYLKGNRGLLKMEQAQGKPQSPFNKKFEVTIVMF